MFHHHSCHNALGIWQDHTDKEAVAEEEEEEIGAKAVTDDG
jgi:hypothetical protein